MHSGYSIGAPQTHRKEFEMNRLLALIAFLTLTAFLAILAFEVPSPDLIIVVLVTLAFVAYDFFTSSKNKKS